jgi:hypothetical protein
VLSPYFGAAFTANKLSYTFEQAPSWTPNGDVLSIAFDSAGIYQIYRSDLNGRGQVCLTCAMVTGPNGVPQERSEKDWILFESYGQQPIHVGNPGLGGCGSDLYVMHPDGTHVYRLTDGLRSQRRRPVRRGDRDPIRQLPCVLVSERQADRLDPHRGRPAV